MRLSNNWAELRSKKWWFTIVKIISSWQACRDTMHNVSLARVQSGYSPVCRRSGEEGPDTRTRDSIIQAWPAPALLGKLISQLEGWCLDAGLSLAGAGIAGLGLAERLVRAGRVFNYPPQPRETRADNWRGRNTEYTIIHSPEPSTSRSDEQEGG